jgi:D-cysteine desulfhydrase
VQACGSGGTTGGIALGSHLAGMGWRVSAYGVCDTPDYFYRHIDGILGGMGASERGVPPAAQLLRCVQARGAGYAVSRDQELATVRDAALATGIILDPVYTGKALHAFLSEAAGDPEAWEGRKVLFCHTGGLLGMADKAAQLQPLVGALGRVGRLRVAGAAGGKGGSEAC